MANPYFTKLKARACKKNDIPAFIEIKNTQVSSSNNLHQRACAISTKLKRLGFKNGDKIFCTMPCNTQFIELIFACFYTGVVPVLIDSGYKDEIIRNCFKSIRPKLWFTESNHSAFDTVSPSYFFSKVNFLESTSNYQPESVIPESISMILYTSGTTGMPKAVPWTCKQLLSQVHALQNLYKDDHINNELTFFSHLAIIAILIGRTAVLPNIDSPQPLKLSMQGIWKQLHDYNIDYVFASPAFWYKFTDFSKKSHLPLPNIKVISTAGAALNAVEVDKLQKIMPDTKIVIPYASTEALMPLCNIPACDFIRLSNSGTRHLKGIPLGKPQSDIGIKITRPDDETQTINELKRGEIGEIIVSGDRVSKEYYLNPKATKKSKLHDENGVIWHKSGDAGYIDNDNNVWFASRVSHSASIDNEQIYPDLYEQFINNNIGLQKSVVICNEELNILFVLVEKINYSNTVKNDIQSLFKKFNLIKPVVLEYPDLFPVDIRHNSKLCREELLNWVNMNFQIRTTNELNRRTFPEIIDLYLSIVCDKTSLINSLRDVLTTYKSNKILDCSIGTGYGFLELIKEGYNINCSDGSKVMLNRLVENAADLNIEINPRLCLWNELNDTFHGELFDTIFCRGNSIVYINTWDNNDNFSNRATNIRSSLQCMFNALAFDGILYVDIPSDASLIDKKLDIGVKQKIINGSLVSVKEHIEINQENRQRTWKVIISEKGSEIKFERDSVYITEDEFKKLLHDVGFLDIKTLKNDGERNHHTVFIAKKEKQKMST